MGIKEIVKENGSKVFEVTVSMRSNVVEGLRLQKSKSQILTLRLAQQVEKELIRAVAEELARRESSGVTWDDLLSKWEVACKSGEMGLRKVQKSTIWEIVGTLRKFTSHWLDRNTQEITPGDVRRILSDMEAKGYSKSRMKAVKSGITTVYKWGMDDGCIKNCKYPPTTGVELGRIINEKPPQILTHAEIQTLLEHARAMNSEWFPIWMMALNTGMRSGELFALEWSDIDFDNKLITVSKSWNGKMKIFKSTKAGYWRKVPINSELESLLLELRAIAKPDDRHVLPRLSQWRRGEAAKVLREFCNGIGLPSVCFHALRACFATHLLNAGVSSPVVKKVCGWTDEKVMSRYIRLAGVDVAGATSVLSFVRPEAEQKKLVNLRDFRLFNRNK